MKGVKPASLIKQNKNTDTTPEPSVMKLSADMFSEFADVALMNQEQYDSFQYLGYIVVINYVLKCLLKIKIQTSDQDKIFEQVDSIYQDAEDTVQAEWNMALEFPENITPEGRTILYEIAAKFQLAYHSIGKKGKSRRTILYPKSVYQDKQKTEITSKHKERNKIRDSMIKKWQFNSDPPVKKTSFTEKVILEMWYEKNNKEPPTTEIKYYIPREEDIGKLPSVRQILEIVLSQRDLITKLETNQQRQIENAKKQLKVMSQQIEEQTQEG